MTRTDQVHVVVTCANRKLHPTPPELRIQRLRQRRISNRFGAWIDRLTTSEAPAIRAEELYGGEHWQIARTLATVAQQAGHRAKTWVCSAGYGLVPTDAALRPYAATFATGHADSVATNTAAAQQWWDYHTSWTGPSPQKPRSISEIARRSPRSAIVCVLSETYLRACSRDLLNAAGRLRDSERMSVITPGTTAPKEVHELVVPVTANLQQRLGGSLQSLNVRAASRLLEMSGDSLPTRDVLMDNLATLGHRLKERKPLNRTALSDEEVLDFINQHLTTRSTHTGLLRELRSAGFACEQGRFASLFGAAAGGGR